VKIDSTSFGEIEFDPETTLSFPLGLIGFQENHEFKLLHSEDFEGLKWLQSISDADLAFSLMEPAEIGYEYAFALSDEETELLGSDNPEELIVLLVVYEDTANNISEDAPSSSSDRSMRANWRTPIILNPVKRIGLQKELSDIITTTLVRGR